MSDQVAKRQNTKWKNDCLQNDHESSWGTYCPSGIPPHTHSTQELNTCLGDLYSVAWIENAEADNLFQETLQSQFAAVVNRTQPKSHPQVRYCFCCSCFRAGSGHLRCLSA